MEFEQLYAVKLFEFECEQARRKRRPQLPCLYSKPLVPEWQRHAQDREKQRLLDARKAYVKDMLPGEVITSAKLAEVLGQTNQSCSNILQNLYRDGVLGRRQKINKQAHRPTYEYFLKGTVR
jgi:hypothetical protein